MSKLLTTVVDGYPVPIYFFTLKRTTNHDCVNARGITE